MSGFSLFRRSSSRASNPTTHGITMRGLSASGASRGLVLLDGVPLTDGFGSWVTWTRLPSLALDSVEIDRGAQGSTFGSDALGGVLTLSSSSPKKPSAAVRATGGDLGIAAVDASAGTTRADSSMFGTVSWFRTDGVIPTAPESAGPIDVPADAEWLSAFGKARFGTAMDQITLSGWRAGTIAETARRCSAIGCPAEPSRCRTTGCFQERRSAQSSPSVRIRSSRRSPRCRRTARPRRSRRLSSPTPRQPDWSREVGRVLPRGFLTARYGLTRTGADFTERRATSSVRQVLDDDSDAVSVHAGWSVSNAVSIRHGRARRVACRAPRRRRVETAPPSATSPGRGASRRM